jgi:hypothetical protein
MTSERHELCEKIFFGATEFAIFIIVSLLITWLVQSNQPVIKQLTPPQVVNVTDSYMDVKWHNRRLLDCPTMGTPLFFTPLATGEIPGRPVSADLQEQHFMRRYHFPDAMIKLHRDHAQVGIDYQAELRILIEAKCNPLWTTQETIRVPFRMPRL